jgi:ATP-dependent DNA helicase RecG
MSKADKEKVRGDVRSGEANFIIGTHALLSEAVNFKNLSFVVIDEQHKFGVRQRAVLSEKGNNPDVLVMTATPIPRTLSLTLFGDLDVSIIDEMPKNRGTIKTQIYGTDQAQEVYARASASLKQGQQAFVVYPVVQESETLDLKAAEAMYQEFRKKIFKDFRVGLVHGQMKRSELFETMKRFKDHDLDLLVATTVLEVGIDVPNANVMIIEHAERFGLAQLHQLRGRIGRGREDAVCYLLADPVTDEALQRLQAISSITDGFVLAEKDLEIRGPGHYFGRHQHGMNELKFANPLRQVDILEQARHEAEKIIHADPGFHDSAHQSLWQTVRQRYPGYLEHIEAG